jgi:hypothetical protein
MQHGAVSVKPMYTYSAAVLPRGGRCELLTTKLVGGPSGASYINALLLSYMIYIVIHNVAASSIHLAQQLVPDLLLFWHNGKVVLCIYRTTAAGQRQALTLKRIQRLYTNNNPC